MPHCGCFPLQGLIISNMGYYFCNHHNKNWLDRDPSTDNNSNVRLAAVLHCYTLLYGDGVPDLGPNVQEVSIAFERPIENGRDVVGISAGS